MISRLLFTTLIFVLLFSSAATAQTVNEERIAFSTADAPWLVSLDSTNLEVQDQQIKQDRKSGYFLLSNEKDGMTVSLFIEPVVKCKTSTECRDFVLKTGNPDWGKFQDLVQSKIGEISYFEFFRPTVQGQPLEIFDMYAEFVEDGYWVDLHLSKVKYKKSDHALFENFVKAVRFVSKTAKPTNDAEKTADAARQALENWMILWDAGKYQESYNNLSTVSKKAFDDKKWSAYYTTARKPLGKLKARKILQYQIIKSLPGVPNQSGVFFRYLSSFENQENVFETFSLILEKDGTWRVASYNTNE